MAKKIVPQKRLKFPGHRPGLPGNAISFYIVSHALPTCLPQAGKAGLAGHVPVNLEFHLPLRAQAKSTV